MPHWCADETLALMYFLAHLPFVGIWFKQKYNEWKTRHDEDETHECHNDDDAGDT